MAQLAAILLTLFGLLPIVNWIAGGHDAPWYDERLRLWLIGTAAVVVITAVVGVALRWRPALWATGNWDRVAVRWRAGAWRADLGIAIVAGVLYALIARGIFSGRPLLTDEIIQVYQARIFAGGRLWLPAGPWPEFTSTMNLIDWGGKVYGQFPAGGPAMLAIGTLLHAEWLVNPIAAAISVFLLARLLRQIERESGAALAALLLFAFCPFVVFMSGSMMNHVTTLMWLLAAGLALTHAIAPVAQRATATYALLTGFCLGMAATIRPLDGLAFALPAAMWLFARALRGSRTEWVALFASGVGVAVPLAALFWVNNAQTGHPFEFGYITMWGKSHELGFHAAPWGPPHTPLRGIELVNLYFLRLQIWLFETPVPALAFATGALLLTRTLAAFDRYLLWSSALLVLAYFGYWHDGFYLGPRFLFPLTPVLALWTARFPSALRTRGASVLLERLSVTSGIVALLLGGLLLVPIRAEQYAHGMSPLRIDGDAAARKAGVHDALVLVRESWGQQLYVRIWALGVSRVESFAIFSRVDVCQLDQLLTVAEGELATKPAEVTERLAAFQGRARTLADATPRLVRLRTVGDSSIHLVPGSQVTPTCLRRIRENQAGFTNFTPILLARDANNLFVRDLHARDSLLVRLHPGRPVYLLLRDTTAASPLRLIRVALDSARGEWMGGAPE